MDKQLTKNWNRIRHWGVRYLIIFGLSSAILTVFMLGRYGWNGKVVLVAIWGGAYVALPIVTAEWAIEHLKRPQYRRRYAWLGSFWLPLFQVSLLALWLWAYPLLGQYDPAQNLLTQLAEPGETGSTKGSNLLNWLLASVVVMGCVNLLDGMIQRLGWRNTLNILTGYYWKPRARQLVFLFMDLNQSTQLAEQMGELRYSAFMQDFFYLIGQPIDESGGEIYQYVGDEVVVTWPVTAGFDYNRCIACYQRIQAVLRERETDFITTYGVRPFFKAGMHTGTAIVAEIGRYKSDIAYHGDSINATARVMSQSEPYGLLITGAMHQLLQPDLAFALAGLGEVALRGKHQTVPLFAVRPAPDSDKLNETTSP